MDNINSNYNCECVSCQIATSASGIGISINDTYGKKYEDVMELITGISGEVVSIKIVEFIDLSYPKEIYFLARDGNVYYLNSESLEKEEYVAKQLENIKNVISIQKIGVATEEHDERAVVATTYAGEKILLSTEYPDVKLK